MRRLFGGGGHVRWCCVEADGVSGGILCIWDSQVLKLVESCVGMFSLSIIFRNAEDGVQWILSGVWSK